jgi:hypothetical protein
MKIDFNVIQPTGLTAEKTSEDSFPAGQQGVGMKLKATVLPTDVNFSNLEVIEIDKGTININGIFTTPYFIGGTQHQPTTTWSQLDTKNQFVDGCQLINVDPSSLWDYGSFDFRIEMRWRVKDTEAGQGEAFENIITQYHTMFDTTGKSTVEKLSRSATRIP